MAFRSEVGGLRRRIVESIQWVRTAGTPAVLTRDEDVAARGVFVHAFEHRHLLFVKRVDGPTKST